MFKTYSAKELLGDKDEKTNYFYLPGRSTSTGFVVFSFQIKKISAIYYDQLLVDY